MVSSICEAKIKSLQFRLFNRFFISFSSNLSYQLKCIYIFVSFNCFYLFCCCILFFVFSFVFSYFCFFGLATICTLYRDHKLHVNHAFIVYMRVGFKKRRLHSIEFANWRLHPLPEQAFTLKFKQSKSTLLKRIIYI